MATSKKSLVLKIFAGVFLLVGLFFAYNAYDHHTLVGDQSRSAEMNMDEAEEYLAEGNTEEFQSYTDIVQINLDLMAESKTSRNISLAIMLGTFVLSGLCFGFSRKNDFEK